MGYRIDYYDQPKVTIHRSKHTSWRVLLATIGFFALFLLSVEHLWPEGRDFLGKVLLNGQDGAFKQMVETFRAGEGVGKAVEAFCREVLSNAGIAH